MRLAIFALLITPLYALSPLSCPAGSPLGRFNLTASSGPNAAHPLESVNRLLPGYKISYRPEHLDAIDKKKARIALLLVPSEGPKVALTDPKPADEPADWTVPFRTQIVGIVWGPAGLDKSKVTHLITKDEELISQLADYAAKVQETQTLLGAITQPQAMDPTQNLGAAVAGFASAYPNAPKLDRTAPTDAQMLTLINGVNPALSTYDPLAQNPQQRAAQTAGLAAAVAGLFFGNTVGLAAGSGAVLFNLHSLFFPNTELRSALAQTSTNSASTLNLCGNQTPSASRTELAFLWAARIPDANAPEISLSDPKPLPIGIKSSVPIDVKQVKDAKLAARAEHWTLISADGNTSLPIAAKVAADAKSVELDLADPNLKPGAWNLNAAWDWGAIKVHGDLELRNFSTFQTARLTPDSQDHLTRSAASHIVHLMGSDFEFVQKLSYKKLGDPFAQPAALPFRLTPPDLETQLDPKQLGAGDYVFLLAQTDGVTHEVPFKVLPEPPEISNLPLTVRIGTGPQTVELHGTGLDRIQAISSADPAVASIAMDNAGKLTVTLAPAALPGKNVALNMSVKDVSEPIVLKDALRIAGPKPVITGVRKSSPGDLGTALNPDEIPDSVFASFALNVANAASVTGVSISCGNPVPVKIQNGETSDAGRLRQESAGTLFLSLNPQKMGQPGCPVEVSLLTPDGPSDSQRLGIIVRLPKLESFQLTDEKSGDEGYAAILQGKDLETLEKAGWDAQTGIPIDAIPTPVAGEPNKERLKIVLPWPAPSPHAPLYIWLRGEPTGRLTTSRY
jgi:hypothetical protein